MIIKVPLISPSPKVLLTSAFPKPEQIEVNNVMNVAAIAITTGFTL